MQAADFVVAKNDLQQFKVITTQLPEALPSDALLVKIDRFAFTANNITYAVGETLKYWHLFPAPKDFGTISGMGIWRCDRVETSRHQ